MKYINVFKNWTFIYKISNSINDKIYIGKTIQPRYRFRQYKRVAKLDTIHVQKIHKAMLELNVDNFVFEVIERIEGAAEATAREDYWITYYKSNLDEYGYNINGGMLPGTDYIIYKLKMSERMSNNNPMFNKKHSAETKKKLSANFAGSKNPFFGKKHSQESKNKIGAAAIMRNTGNNNPRAKLSDAQVIEIRRLWLSDDFTKSELAVKFSVTTTTISDIVRRKTRKDI